jgi:RHS repeat-associated protein
MRTRFIPVMIALFIGLLSCLVGVIAMAETISRPVSVRMQVQISRDGYSKPVSVRIPVQSNGDAYAVPVSVALPTQGTINAYATPVSVMIPTQNIFSVNAYTNPVSIGFAQQVEKGAFSWPASVRIVPPVSLTINPILSPSIETTKIISGGKGADFTSVLVSCPGAVIGKINYPNATTWNTTLTGLKTGNYTVSVAVVDVSGYLSGAVNRSFAIDITPPIFTVDTYTDPSPSATQTIFGKKEAGSIVKLNGVTLFDATDQNTTWSTSISLVDGIRNRFTFTAADALGNTTTKTLDILYDSAAPASLGSGVVTADGSGRGTEVTLAWPSYPESPALAYYRVYQAAADFTSTSSLTSIATVTKGSMTFKATGLTQGTRYWFAVAPVSVSGNSDPAVHTVSAIPADTLPPEDITALTATAGYSSTDGNYVTLSWAASKNSKGDLTNQIVYLDNGTGYDAGTVINNTTTTFTKKGLADAGSYKFKVTAKDSLNHESAGTVIQAVTRLANPDGLAALPGNLKATLSWGKVTSPYFKSYKVYRLASDVAQSDVLAMTLVKSQTGNSFIDTGLVNGVTYQYAVTVLNTSGAERTSVQSISTVPRADTTGPVITGPNLTSNQVISAPLTITASATDAESAMNRIEIYINGTLAKSQTGGSVSYVWNVADTTDGNHTVRVVAYDAPGNSSESVIPVVVSLAPPTVPVITSQFSGPTNQTSITINGTTQSGSTVVLRVNGVVSKQAVSTSTAFSFSGVTLVEGDNLIAVKALNRAGESAFGADLKVTVDAGAPPAPIGFTAKTLAAGTLQFIWQRASGEVPTGFNLYESSAPFTTKGDAGVRKVNTTPIVALLKEYLPSNDSLRYFAVTAIDGAGNESPLSGAVSIASDRLAPTATVAFTAASGTAPGDNIYGPGALNVTLTVSEALNEAPFLSLEPQTGSPVVAALKKTDDTHYTATLTIDSASPNGSTTWKFSGKDLAGNRGNSQGAGPVLDVHAPQATITAPVTLLKTTAGVLAVSVTLDEASTITPVMSLTAQGGSVPLTSLTSTDNVHWSGTLDPVGLAEGTGIFVLSDSRDRFGNRGGSVSSGANIILYRTTPPASSVPGGLAVKAFKGREVKLAWQVVTDAQGYRIYRQGTGDAAPVMVAEIVGGATVSASDTPPANGSYAYSISSLGFMNVESAQSAQVSVVADGTAPLSPASLVLAKTGNGVKADWQAPSGEAPAYYRLYRSASPISDIAGLTPVATVKVFTAYDPSPNSTLPYYAVTSMDLLGNESAPSGGQGIVFPVLPVKDLVLIRVDDGHPSLSWLAGEANLQGYHIYRNGSRITTTPTPSASFDDAYYSAGAVTYGISAINSAGMESDVREVILPELLLGLKEGTILRRGMLENIVLTAALPAGATTGMTLDSVKVKIGALPESVEPGPFEIAPATTLEIPKVAAAETTAPAEIAVVATAVITPSAGVTVKLTRSLVAAVMASGAPLEIFNEPLLRGTQAKVRLKITNTGSARADIVTSERGGPSSQVRVLLKDQDGNILAQGKLNQRVGSQVVDSGTYATVRLEPEESFLSDPVTFTVPATAPYKVTLEAVIDATYNHYKEPDQVTAPGMKTSVEGTITDVSYRATAVTDKAVYKQGEPVIITGATTSTNDSAPMPYVPVKIGISVKGFDRFATVNSDASGNFSYTFTPAANEAGGYSVWAIHPDLTDRTVQAQFSIIGLQVTPLKANLRLQKGKYYDVPVSLTNLGGTPLNGLAFTLNASSGFSAAIVNPGATTLKAGERRSVIFRITSDPTAPDNGYATLDIATTEGLGNRINADLVTVSAIPVIVTSPSYIDTGLVRGSQKITNFTIKNSGSETLKNPRIEGPSIPWLALTVDKTIGDIPTGQIKTVGFLIKPGETVAQGVYDDRIVIYSDNHIPYTYNIQVTVTSNAVGNVLFSVLNELMKDVAGANITLQNQNLPELYYTKKTGADGSVALFDIPEGRYAYNISAPGHKPYSGSFVITPGITTSVPIALEVTLVTVEWSVTPVTITDSYQIKVTQTFETNVRTAVIVTDPPAIQLPKLQPGQVFNGEYTITNHGLIAADYSGIKYPATFNDDFDLEVLAKIPARLDAGQRIVVPYRITRRVQTAQASIAEEVTGYGGGSCSGSTGIDSTWTATICPDAINQRTVTRTSTHSIYWNSCTPSTQNSGGGTGTTTSGGTYSGGQSNGTQAGSGSSLPPGSSAITPIANGEPGCIYPNSPNVPPNPDHVVCTGSYVNVSNGTYVFDEIDLRIPAPAQPIELNRTYRSNGIMRSTGTTGGNDTWSFTGPSDSPFGFGWHAPWFALAGDGMYLDGEGNYYEFTKNSAGGYQPHAEAGLILTKTASGYEIKERGGNSYQFGSNGKLLTIKPLSGSSVTLNYDATGKLIAIADAANRPAVTFAYDTNSHITSATDITGRIITYDYDSYGNLTTVSNSQTVTSTYNYDLTEKPLFSVPCHYGTFTGPICENNRCYTGTISGMICASNNQQTSDPNTTNTFHNLIERKNAVGEKYNITYPISFRNKGIVGSITNPDGKTSTFTPSFSNATFYNNDYDGRLYKRLYNNAGKLIYLAEIVSGTDQLIKKIDYLDGRTENITDSAGNVTTVQKDEWGNIIKHTDGEGNITTYSYNGDGQIILITDPLATITRFEYLNGKLIKETRSEGKPEQSITTYSYDGYGQVTSRTTNGATTAIVWNSAGLPASITDPLGNKTQREYNAYGNLRAEIDSNGNRSEYGYDAKGNLLTAKDPLGNITSYTWNAANRLASMTDPLGRTTNIETNFKGRITATIDPLGNRNEYAYDGDGNLRQVTEGDGITTLSHDSAGRLLNITDPLGNSTRYEYGTNACPSCGGSAATPSKITDPLGNITQGAFNKAGKLTGITDPLGNITNIIRDAADRATKQTDANGNQTGYQYGSLGRITRQTDATGGTTDFSYDANGNLKTLTDPNGNTTTFDYDLNGRKTKETRPMGQTTEYSYWPTGTLKTSKDAKNQTTIYNYDKNSRLTEIAYADSTKDTFGYDAVGNLTSYAKPGIQGTITYDELRRKTGETVNYGTFSKSFSYTYDAKGNKATYTSPQNTTYSYGFNKNGQPTSITFSGKTITLDYQWIRQTKQALPNGINTNFGYNANSWLSAMETKQNSTTLGSQNYQFDNVGNITGKTGDIGAAYGYDKIYQLTSAGQVAFSYDKTGNRTMSGYYSHNANNELTAANTATYTYDANGNTIAKTENNQTTTYGYDARNSLTQITLPDGTIANYTYDPFGRRIKKQTPTGTTYYLYANEGLIGEYTETGTIKKAYGWRPKGIWGTNPLFQIDNGNYYFYHNDHLGTPQRMTDESGSIVWSATYSAFGKATVTASTISNNLRYSGQYADEETGLHYNWFRYYDPGTGRYVSVDPLGFLAGDTNLYRYAQNNPINKTDPTGLATYLVNRKIGGSAALSYSDDISHTFVAITDDTGKVTNTYSWGNIFKPMSLKTTWAPPNMEEDLIAASLAIEFNLANKVSDGALDNFVRSAYSEMKKEPYQTWGFPDTCKDKAKGLIRRATELYQDYLVRTK